jgi:hypothetical protein
MILLVSGAGADRSLHASADDVYGRRAWRSMGNHKKTPRSPVAYVSFQRLLKPYPSNFRTFVNAVMNRSISSCVL